MAVSSLSGLSTSGLSFGGLATGIDSTKIIEGLTKISQQRIDTLTARKQQVLDRQGTFVALQTRLAGLQLQTNKLARSAGGAFDGRSATISDDKLATAVAGTAAVAGTYALTVQSIARAHQTASAGFVDSAARIKEGTFSVQAGSGQAVTVTIDPLNNTVQGLADAINNAGGEVRASLINDGSATPYRLLLTSTKTGTAGAITVTNNLTNGTGASIDPTATTVQAASDARVSLGSGAGAITVTNSTNTINSLIPGVSLTLKQADLNNPVTLTVVNDTETATAAVKDFVSSYNQVIDFIGEQTKFDSESSTAGTLLGDRNVADLQNAFNQVITSVVPGIGSGPNRLSAIGVSLGGDGRLSLDEGKLSQAISGGTALSDLKKLFGLTGSSDNTAVQFGIGTSKTKPSGPTGYQLQVTQAATRASVTAGSALPGVVTISPPNNTLMIRLNGLASSGIELSAGTYTPDQVAGLLQQAINSNTSLSDNRVSVSLDGSNKLSINSQQFGSGSTVSFAGGSALSVLGFTGSETGSGLDVAGQFLVGGVIESATGAGQTLTGKSGNANTDGLLVRVTAPTPTTANVTVTQGIAGQLNSALNKFLDSGAGKFKTMNDDFNSQIEAVDTQITKQNALMTEKKNELTLKFAAMEAAVSKLKGVGASLTALIPKATY